jgi:hypothetical protein
MSTGELCYLKATSVNTYISGIVYALQVIQKTMAIAEHEYAQTGSWWVIQCCRDSLAHWKEVLNYFHFKVSYCGYKFSWNWKQWGSEKAWLVAIGFIRKPKHYFNAINSSLLWVVKFRYNNMGSKSSIFAVDRCSDNICLCGHWIMVFVESWRIQNT